MGQQQLLLIVLGTIIVGVALVVGIQIFSDSAANTNVDMTTSELIHYAWSAQEYYRRPTAFGGGGKTFTGWSLSDTSENAIYTASVSAQVATVTGICLVATKNDGAPVTIVVTVNPNTLSTQVDK